MISIKREDCPSYVPLPEGVEGQTGYGDMEGIEVGYKLKVGDTQLTPSPGMAQEDGCLGGVRQSDGAEQQLSSIYSVSALDLQLKSVPASQSLKCSQSPVTVRGHAVFVNQSRSDPGVRCQTQCRRV